MLSVVQPRPIEDEQRRREVVTINITLNDGTITHSALLADFDTIYRVSLKYAIVSLFM